MPQIPDVGEGSGTVGGEIGCTVGCLVFIGLLGYFAYSGGCFEKASGYTERTSTQAEQLDDVEQPVYKKIKR